MQNSCERLTVGRGSQSAKQPIVYARELMKKADGAIVIAFTRTIVEKAVEKPGGAKPVQITNVRYPTIWNQLEAAMAFGLDKPLLMILEEGLNQEAMLKDRLEYRALVTPLDPGFFKTDDFKGIFADWLRMVQEQAASKPPLVDVGGKSVVEILKSLKPGEFWQVLAALFAILSGVAVGSFWVAKNLSSTPANKPAIVLPPKSP